MAYGHLQEHRVPRMTLSCGFSTRLIFSAIIFFNVLPIRENGEKDIVNGVSTVAGGNLLSGNVDPFSMS